MKKFHAIVAVIACIALITVGFMGARLFDKKPKVEVSATSIAEQLTACSELAAARLDYRGIVHYSEGSIPLFDKKAFSMIYDAEIKAGIDLSEAKVKVQKDEIQITLPEAKILSVEINPDTLEFYDQQFALFNWTNKNDTTNAIKYAKEDANAKADQAQLTEEAFKQTKSVISALLGPLRTSAGEKYEITFK